MKVLSEKSKPLRNVSLILGFFDGVHAGHQKVITTGKGNKTVLVTFTESPAEYFSEKFNYIYPRSYNYKLIKSLGVDSILELDFRKIVNYTAKEYLDFLIKKFSPISITTGFNHTFGAKRQGNPKFLEENQGCYRYICTQPCTINGEIVSSTKIKELLSLGNIEKANLFLQNNFVIESKVIEGAKIGRTLGFPTANMRYPDKIVKIPYGVYKIRVFGLPAIMDWGIKPTIGAEETIEVHIPNFKQNLYGENLQIEILSKIRDERKFETLEDLKKQIAKDVEECLK